MTSTIETLLLVLAEKPVEVQAASALQSAAQALGYAEGCSIVQLGDASDLKRLVYEVDPWAVMAIDDASIAALQEAFKLSSSDFRADYPASVSGYALVAVPGFAECLDDPDAKRIAWKRMHAAAHPKNPLD